MLELAGVGKDDVVYDLGCGDGRIPVTAARKYGCHAAGYDIDPECIRMSRENVERHKMGPLDGQPGQRNKCSAEAQHGCGDE